MNPIQALFLGSGNAFNSGGRASQAIWLSRAAQGGDPDLGLLVDCAHTTGLSIERFGLDTRRLDQLLLTHLHYDHFGGWPTLLLRLIFIDRRTRPLRVVGPIGTRQTLDALGRLAYGDLLGESALPFEISWTELPVATGAGPRLAPGLQLDSIVVDHAPSSLAFVLRTEAACLGISGDTAWCPGVEELIDRSDDVILECTTVEPSAAKHISVRDLRRHEGRLVGKRCVLVHVSDEVQAALEAEPLTADVTCAEDGLRWTLA